MLTFNIKLKCSLSAQWPRHSHRHTSQLKVSTKPLLRSTFSPDSCDFLPPPPVIGAKLAFSTGRGAAIFLLGNQTGHLKARRLFFVLTQTALMLDFLILSFFSYFSLNDLVWLVYENKQVKTHILKVLENFDGLIILYDTNSQENKCTLLFLCLWFYNTKT